MVHPLARAVAQVALRVSLHAAHVAVQHVLMPLAALLVRWLLLQASHSQSWAAPHAAPWQERPTMRLRLFQEAHEATAAAEGGLCLQAQALRPQGTALLHTPHHTQLPPRLP